MKVWLTVKDIIETAEVNRNTFYYYFEDIYDLLSQIFQMKLDDFCRDMKICDTFYEEYIRSAEFLMKNKKAMFHIYHSRDRELLQVYLEKITESIVEQFVRKKAVSYDIEEKGIEYLTKFHSYTIVGNAMHWIRDGMPPYRERYLFLVSKSFEDSIDDLIRSLQEKVRIVFRHKERHFAMCWQILKIICIS